MGQPFCTSCGWYHFPGECLKTQTIPLDKVEPPVGVRGAKPVEGLGPLPPIQEGGPDLREDTYYGCTVETNKKEPIDEGPKPIKVHNRACTCKHCMEYYDIYFGRRVDTTEKEQVTEYGNGARTEQAPFDLTQIPMDSLLRLAAVFKEGEKRYGRDNWRQGVGDRAFQLERANHAIKHLLYFVHALSNNEYLGEDTPEMDLAKVAWFCVTQQELMRLETENGTSGNHAG